MDHTYWHRQTTEKPLFPDLLWSRPENKRQAGKLGIIGGNANSFAAVGTAYNAAVEAGAGTTRILLPDSLQKTVSKLFPEAEFAPSTPSGSFARDALASWLALAEWADGVLVAGDLGHNSETAIVLEQFIEKYDGQLTITQDAIDYFASQSKILDRAETTLVLSFAQLQKLATTAHVTRAFRFDMDFLHLVDNLHELTEKHPVAIVVKHLENMFVAAAGQVSSTKLATDLKIWRVSTAAAASVWWLQNPVKQFEAQTTALL
jgi:NAD(P)H-hydrate repair Nnr-like enzyme with NAD(P)H-hydrate dehydratase domain